MKKITIHGLTELTQAAKWVLDQSKASKILAFYGEMGAGKTTLIKAICSELGISDTVTSPTFAIVNEYAKPQGGVVFHFDFYRINKLEELLDFGYEEYFYSNELCLLEWPERIESLLPEGTKKILITENEDGSRTISS